MNGGLRLGAIQWVEFDADVSVANMIAQRGTRPGGTSCEVEAIVTSTLCEAGLSVIVYDLAPSDGRTG